MINGLLGKKLGMTGIYDEAGNRISVTAVQLGPGYVVQKKTLENDGYEAVQIGFMEVKGKGKLEKFKKPLKGHFGDVTPCKHLKEFKADDLNALELGQKIESDIFTKGDFVDVSGTSKGRGFAGVIKRHGFGGGPESHGHRFHRSTGSIGNCTTPGRVFKNKKMPGQYGNARVTIRGLKIIDVLKDENVILVKGCIPGPTGKVVEVCRTKKKFRTPKN